MKNADEIARDIWNNLADRSGSGLDSWDREIKDQCIQRIAAALRDAWEGGHKAGKKFLENVNEYHKQAVAEGYKRGREDEYKKLADRLGERGFSEYQEGYRRGLLEMLNNDCYICHHVAAYQCSHCDDKNECKYCELRRGTRGGGGGVRNYQLRKSNGKWRKATLQDLGVNKESINTDWISCSKCGKDWFPIIKQDPCFDCQKPTQAGRE